MNKKILYFGCSPRKYPQAGHYLHDGEQDIIARNVQREYPGLNLKFLEWIDGVYCPAPSAPPGTFRVTRIGAEPIIIIAWIDNSVDKRPGSNSAIIAFGYKSTDDIFADFNRLYLNVALRQLYMLKPEPATAD